MGINLKLFFPHSSPNNRLSHLFLFLYLSKIQFNPITSYGNESSKYNIFSSLKYWLLWLAHCNSGSYPGIMVWYQYFQKLICSNSDSAFFPAASIPYVTFVCHLRSNLLALKFGVTPSVIFLFSFSSVYYRERFPCPSLSILSRSSSRQKKLLILSRLKWRTCYVTSNVGRCSDRTVMFRPWEYVKGTLVAD